MIARAVVQKCEGLNVHTLFTFGSQHQGWKFNSVTSTRGDEKGWWTHLADHIGKHVQEWLILQDFATPFEYFISKIGWAKQYGHSEFLPDLNNELPVKNLKYKERMLALKHFGLYKFADDITLRPKESQWMSIQSSKREIPLRF